MFRRIFNTSSPLGIALTVAGVVLALSPEARQAARRMLVKGTAAILGVVDQVKEVSANMSPEVQRSADFLDDAKSSVTHSGEASEHLHGNENHTQLH
ncbi:hypothetical protein DNHGIG_28010 [Collibacillus ludicampi]|jgi:hypothetical protein|uniref:YtxH domain-containing protein n=1 Tax=Collibacillus ludicampi TaxID=2771369 RepID=A0AAV4LHF2_9BACL|nr:hypothetical protein [Collibacillus ludicampi]GIM47252.1 hypothetical protein DNHGIG_28010 [Collibacillus ludicampi]